MMIVTYFCITFIMNSNRFSLLLLEYAGPYLHIDKEWSVGKSFIEEYNVSKGDNLVRP